MNNHETAAQISENIDTTTTFCFTPEDERATYTARIVHSGAIYFDNDHVRIGHTLEITRTTSRSTKTFRAHTARDFRDGEHEDARVVALYNENRNQVHSKQFDNYRAAALHAVANAEADLAVAPAETPEEPARPEVPACAPEINPADYAEPVARSPRLPETRTDAHDRLDVSPAEARWARDSEPFGYVCKSCGGPSPVGVGYIAQGQDAESASASVDHCACGYSRRPAGGSTTERAAEHLMDAAVSRREYLDALTSPGPAGRAATAAQRRYKRAMAAYWDAATRAAHEDLHHLKMHAEAGDLDAARAERDSLRHVGLLRPRPALSA